MDNRSIPKRVQDVEIIEMADGVVIQCGDVLHTLNETAVEVIELCDGKRSVSEIIEEMKKQYNNETVDSIIDDFITNLLELKLIEIA